MEGEERRAIQVQKLAANLLELKRIKEKYFQWKWKGRERGKRERKGKGKEREGSEENVHNPFILLPALVKAVLVSFMSISFFLPLTWREDFSFLSRKKNVWKVISFSLNTDTRWTPGQIDHRKKLEMGKVREEERMEWEEERENGKRRIREGKKKRWEGQNPLWKKRFATFILPSYMSWSGQPSYLSSLLLLLSFLHVYCALILSLPLSMVQVVPQPISQLSLFSHSFFSLYSILAFFWRERISFLFSSFPGLF